MADGSRSIEAEANAAAADAAREAKAEALHARASEPAPRSSRLVRQRLVRQRGEEWAEFKLDVWITNLNSVEFGIYKRSRNRAKSRQFTADMDIFAEIVEAGERTGLLGYREDLWTKNTGMDKRLVLKLFTEAVNWRATMDLMIGRSLQLTLGARGLPVTCFSLNTGDTSPFTGTGTISNVSLFAPPNQIPFMGTPSVTGDPDVINLQTSSLYMLHTANFRDFIIINGGVRYDDYNIGASKAGYGEVGLTSQLVNYNAGIVVKPLPFASIYAAYGTSANPVGAEIDGTSAAYGGLNPTSPVKQIFGPQRNKAYEAGTKWELFDKHLLLTGALFRTETENAREVVPSATNTPGGVPLPTGVAPGSIVAGNSSYVQGIDLEAAGKITDRWSLMSGLVLMESKVTQSVLPTDVGDKLANIAHQSFTTLTKYQVTDNLELGGQAIYRSKLYGGTLLAANQGTELPSYWRFDAFAEYKIDKNWSTKIGVLNMFNKTYYDAFYQSASPFVLIAPGRSFYWKVEAKF